LGLSFFCGVLFNERLDPRGVSTPSYGSPRVALGGNSPADN
jgi:hypothetical protein